MLGHVPHRRANETMSLTERKAAYVPILFVLWLAASVEGAALRQQASYAQPTPLPSSSPAPGPHCAAGPFDYYRVVQFWPPENCTANPICEDRHFTLHGLWPQDFSGNFPCFCLNDPFNETAVQPILPEMNEYWSAGIGLWAHEWEKHGTCIIAAENPPFHTQREFFETALALRQRYAVVPALRQAGFKPSNTSSIPVGSLKKAWKEFFGGFPEITCDSTMRLSGWVFCFDKLLRPIDCPLHNLDTCTGSVTWPTI